MAKYRFAFKILEFKPINNHKSQIINTFVNISILKFGI